MAVKNLESTSKTTSFHLIAAHPKKTVRLPSAEFLCLLFLFFLRSSPPDVAPIESSERTHERTCERRDHSDLSFFPGPAPDGRVSLFLPIFFSPFLYRSPSNGTGRKFPPPGWRPNASAERTKTWTICVACCEPYWSSVIKSVQYYPRKTRVFIFPVPMNGPAVR